MSALAASTEGLGVVVALSAEARSLGAGGLHPGDCARWHRGWLAVSGIGGHNAMRAAERLLACGVGALANWGVAGAVDARLAPGDLLIPDRIRYRDDDALGFVPDADASAWLARRLADGPRVFRGGLWSAPQPVASAAAKRALGEHSGALAVDMEAAAVAAVATRAQLPFTAVKAICDPCARDIPPRITRALDAGGGVTLAMASAIVFGGPPSWRVARLLARDFARARDALATAARLLAVRA
ncbi:MAG TPA: hypothetical protein VFL63_00780 [Rhodanobacteraceae bacterium]|jgi:hypothetical protein|nr:hypothetical protein [Rhodanobacteraceae bacterium]